MNKIKLMKEFMVFVNDKHVKSNYPLIYQLLTKKLYQSGIDVKDFKKD